MTRLAYFGESGAPLARTQEAAALGLFGEDEDAASGVIWPLKGQQAPGAGH